MCTTTTLSSSQNHVASLCTNFPCVIFAAGVGVGLTRDASGLMVGQYFKRRRDFVESVLVSASGMGIILMTIFMEFALRFVL